MQSRQADGTDSATGIDLPLPPVLRVSGPLLIGIAGSLPLLAPLQPGWRLGMVLLTIVWGLILWHRFLRTRTAQVTLCADGRLFCKRADGRSIAIESVIAGHVGRLLVSAQLAGDGGRAPLFVPSQGLSRESHWVLRRAVLGFRSSAAAPGGQSADLGGR